MKFTSESKILIGILTATIGIVTAAVFLFSRPSKPIGNAQLVPQGTAVLGDSRSPVTLVEFSDFQCPACKAAEPFVDDILKNFGSSVLFAYRHFPLDRHPFAQKAAEAAEAAGAQGKFWEMHNLLFDHQESLSDETISSLASQLSLNMEVFGKALKDGAYRQKVLADRADGERLGVAATPTFFLNGKKLELTSFEQLKARVGQAIETLSP